MINFVVERNFVVKKCCPVGKYILNSQPDFQGIANSRIICCDKQTCRDVEPANRASPAQLTGPLVRSENCVVNRLLHYLFCWTVHPNSTLLIDI